MLNDKDYLEATRRFKNKKEHAHARQRYHALLLVTKGYSYRETADILLVDEETLSRWTELYQERGLDGLKNHPQWGGEHGQRLLTTEELARRESRCTKVKRCRARRWAAGGARCGEEKREWAGGQDAAAV